MFFRDFLYLFQCGTGKDKVNATESDLGDAQEYVDDNFAGLGKSSQPRWTVLEAQFNGLSKVRIRLEPTQFLHFSRAFQLENF